MPGILYICATPIGNLDDITYRVVKALNEVDIIACEDTRHTQKLLNHLDIKKQTISYHEHNRREKGQEIIELLLQEKNIALVTDAGTPCISDPGEDLVKLVYENNIKVTSLPGPSAIITALTISGQSTEKFIFEGFLSRENKYKKERLELLKKESRTIVIYEAPHRLLNTLKDLNDFLGDRDISIIRELTKKYEEVKKTTISNAVEFYTSNEPRGEYVLVIAGEKQENIQKELIREWEKISMLAHMEIYLKEGFEQKEAMKKVAKDRGIKKSDVYSYIIKQKSSN